MKKTICILFTALLFTNEICAQSLSATENAFKYWYYRDRLKYFVMPGTDPGQSLLFSRRNASRENWDATAYSMNMEQPHMMMGFYVGMLATEYKLLKDNGQTTSANETLIELNLALDALIRMDKCEDDIP
ncbi:MAG: hypothetical protein AB7V36_05260 [Bacteroidales bacterium]